VVKVIEVYIPNKVLLKVKFELVKVDVTMRGGTRTTVRGFYMDKRNRLDLQDCLCINTLVSVMFT